MRQSLAAWLIRNRQALSVLVVLAALATPGAWSQEASRATVTEQGAWSTVAAVTARCRVEVWQPWHLLQAPSKSCTLTIAGSAHTFDTCQAPSSDSPFQLFLSATADADGGTLLRGGLRAPEHGWVGWGLGRGRMFGSYTVIVKSHPTEGGCVWPGASRTHMAGRA